MSIKVCYFHSHLYCHNKCRVYWPLHDIFVVSNCAFCEAQNTSLATTHPKVLTTEMKLQFLPRDAMCKRGLSYRLVSVRPSVTFVHCIQTTEDIVKLISAPDSPSF